VAGLIVLFACPSNVLVRLACSQAHKTWSAWIPCSLMLRWMQDKRLLVRYDADVAEHEKKATEPPSKIAGNSSLTPYQRLPSQAARRVVDERELVVKAPPAIVVHCTHGYNRSGYMMVHYAKRFSPNISVAECIRRCGFVPIWCSTW
jgi:hypothetical protein